MKNESSTISNAQSVLKLVALNYNLRVADLKSGKSVKGTRLPRTMAAYLLRKHFMFSLPEIARHLSCKDIDVHNLLIKASSEKSDNPEFNRIVDLIEPLITIRSTEPANEYCFFFTTPENRKVEISVRVSSGTAL